MKSTLDRFLPYCWKMDSTRSVLNLVANDCFMCTVDLKDAYFSVKVEDEFQCYLTFQWKQKLLKFACFPNELGPCPRKFAKISNKKLPRQTFASEVFQLMVLLRILSLKVPPIHSVKRMFMMLL